MGGVAMFLLTNGAFLKRLNDRTELSDAEYERFLKRKSLLKKTNWWGENALIIALYNGHLKLAKELIKHGADINMVVKKRKKFLLESTLEGSTPLSLAVGRGYVDIAAQLIERGADINIVTSYGDTALSLAAANGHTDVVKLLIERGADIHICAEYGGTALIAAARNGYMDIVTLLIEQGADINIYTKYSGTALICAVNNGHTDIAKLLIERGADINITNKDGFTALSLAIWNGHRDIARLLIERGADVNIANKDGFAPLDLADNNGYMDITNLLVARGAKKRQEVQPPVKEPRTDSHTVRVMSGVTLVEEIIRQIDEENQRNPVVPLKESGFESAFEHSMKICDVCGCPLNPDTTWFIPINIFYYSPKYRQWMKDNRLSFYPPGTMVEQIINDMRARDNTPGSMVCSDCVELFR